MRDKLMLTLLAISAVALLLVWFSIEPPAATVAAEDAESDRAGESAERRIGIADTSDSAAFDLSSNISSHEAPRNEDPQLVPEDAQSIASSDPHPDDLPTREFERKYIVGKFPAPEHLQIAVYKAVNDELDGYVAFVDNMECDSGDCDIDIRIVAPTEVSARGADLFERINGQLADNPLTRSIVVGIRSMRVDENRDGRLQLVTMPRSTDDEIARAIAEIEQRRLQQLPIN